MAEQKIRNIAIIAHVDHGKTTLVDGLLRQSGTFRSNEVVAERVMDSMDLERERGITIMAKNTSVQYQDYKINIVDTPGHADFGGEVERTLKMVDGVMLLVDASEGPLPQTRFVLKKALEDGLKVIVCINKIDRSDARVDEVVNEVFDLFVDLDAEDWQVDFPIVYAVARDGWAVNDLKDRDLPGKNLEPLFKLILDVVPAPKGKPENPLQILVTNIGYNNFVGRLAIGRVREGVIKVGDTVSVCKADKINKIRVVALFTYEGLKQVETKEVPAGDIVIIAGEQNIEIGDTISDGINPLPLPRVVVEEPTVSMIFSVNNGPFAGKEGDQVTSRKILERLEKELLYNVSLRMEKTDATDSFKVFGRGELQLAILIEQMRREGFELLISKPKVVTKVINGEKHEPMENVVFDVPEATVGIVTEKMGLRKGVMTNMNNKGSGRVRVEFLVPSRGLIGYRSEFLTDTKGAGLMNSIFAGYEPWKGDIGGRMNGALIADRLGDSVAYGLFHLEPRGRMFIGAGIPCYEGMVIGEHAKDNDLIVNVAREKKLTNMRSSGADEAVKLTPPAPTSLEQSLEWISDDELVEVTPKNIRLRKRYLDPNKRKRAEKAD
ncbi:MAG: translational GTPase TypA [Oligoflexia bacterium]|nr:translational GTPase TypA [Oligoflexia bacterium]